MADPQLVSTLGPLLAAAVGEGVRASTASIKQATDALSATYKRNVAQAVPALVEIALSNSSEAIRQLAAVEARKRVEGGNGKGWERCSPPARTAVKERLLAAIQSPQPSTSRPTLHKLCQVAQAIYAREHEASSWPAFLPALFTLCTTAATQETGLYILLGVLDELATPQLRPEIASPLFGLLASALAPSQPLGVRVFAARALGRLTQLVTPEDEASVQAISSQVPAMLQLGSDAIRAGELDAINDAYEQLDALALCENPAMLNPHFTDVVANCLSAGAAADVDPDLRLAPCNALLFVIKYRRNRIQALGLGKPILEGLMPIAAQDEPEDMDEDSPSRIALRIVDILATVLPPAQIAQPLLELCTVYSASADPRMRKASVAAFGQIVDGCSLFLQPLLPQIWPLIDHALADPDVIVRKAGCIALSAMTGQLGTDVGARHDVFVPAVVRLAGQPETQRLALNALDTLLECLEPEGIAPYLQALMELLLSILPTVEGETKTSVIGAIGSAAHAAKTAFTPYFATTMSHLMPMLAVVPEADDQEAAESRGVAQDTVGTLAVSVGREVFDPYFAECMRLAMEATALKSPGLRECSFTFFTVVSRVYKADMAPYLTSIMPVLLACVLQEDDPTAEAPATLTNGGALTLANGGDDGFEDIEDISVASDDIFGSSALVLEQEVAVQALGELFDTIREPFSPYVETAVKAIDLCLDNPYEGIRKAAVQAFATYVRTVFSLSGAAKPATPSLHPPQLPADVHRLAAHVVGSISKILPDEDETTVVQAVLEEFSDLLTTCGAAVIQPSSVFADLCKLALEVLQRRHASQRDEDDDEAPQSDALAEWDAALIRSAQDFVAAVAGALGPDFAPNFAMLLPAMARYYEPQRESAERAGTIGALAECCNGLGSGVTPYTESLFQLFSQALHDGDLDVRSNAAYAAGVLVYHSDADLSAHYLGLLGALRPLFDPPELNEDTLQARDNASGAVARLILKNAAALPLDQVAPVLLASLPIATDFVENIKVVPALIALAQSSVGPAQLDPILAVFHTLLERQRDADVVDAPAKVSPQITPETRQTIVSFVGSLPPQHQARFQGLI